MDADNDNQPPEQTSNTDDTIPIARKAIADGRLSRAFIRRREKEEESLCDAEDTADNDPRKPGTTPAFWNPQFFVNARKDRYNSPLFLPNVQR
jgi:hypothetical protein